MHAATHTASAAFPAPVAGRPWWTKLARAAAAEYRARRATRELAGLDEHALRDIGLDRGGLEHAARHGRCR